MPGFRFRLQRVLKLREHIENGCAREVGVARNELERREDILRELMDAREEGSLQIAAQGEGMVAAGRFALLNSALEQLQHSTEEARKACIEAQKILDAAIERHTEARQSRETLSRLRAKARREWFVEEGRAEQKEMDEVARTMAFSRR